MNQLIHGDCIAVMRTLPDNSVDSIVTDPPYGLGFMGKAWDALPPGLDWAVECLRVLKPGGHLLAFGGTRTWHRLAVAVEDAGFEIRDSIAWMYGSGFPKHRAALKPGFEPAVLGRKPFKGGLEANEAVHGTGALSIDACRITPTDGYLEYQVTQGQSQNAGSIYGGDQRDQAKFVPHDGGRWPANVVLDELSAEELDGQSGITKSGVSARGGTSPAPMSWGQTRADGDKLSGHNDSGGASRFFYVAKAPKSERPEADGVKHTTVKPLTLMRHLVKLVTPAGGTVLEPFAGSGTTVEACILEGYNYIAIEREAEYLPLIQIRIDRAVTSQLEELL